jgi:sulfide:quinone oxidoreductase
LAGHIRQKRLKGKIIFLDSNTAPQPPPLSRPIEEAIQKNQDIIEYVPSARVVALEAGSKRVITQDGERFGYDFLCLIPPHRAALFIEGAGLSVPGDPFVDVDPFTFRSTKFDAIYALGDVARMPYSRTASSASLTAQICAHEIARALGVQVRSPSSFESVCYPYVNHEQALKLALRYWQEGGNGGPRVESRVIADTQPRQDYVQERKNWSRALLREMFGA